MRKQLCYLLMMCMTRFLVHAQVSDLPRKISHAEPLYYDLVRDLGALKGEQEFNLGIDFIHTKKFNKQVWLAEYEFAPVNRLAFEVETDLALYHPYNNEHDAPQNNLEGLRFSVQYTFLVAPALQTSAAVGYNHIFEWHPFSQLQKQHVVKENIYSPFLVAAKVWGNYWHTLCYVSPLIHQAKDVSKTEAEWQINSSVFYNIPQSKHYIGIEFNSMIQHQQHELTVRPQVKLKLNKQMAVGMVAGLPLNKNNHLSTFFRIIYEP